MIKNLTHQLNEAGKIKIGKKGEMIVSKTGVSFRPPKKLDHFQLVTTEKDDKGDYVIDVALQNRIKEAGTGILDKNGCLVGIPIRLLYNDSNLNFPHQYVSYVNGKMSCRGDGEVSFKRVDDFAIPHKCPCPRCEQGYEGKDKCKPTGTLTCIIDEAGYFGQAHKFRTTSLNSIKGILGSMELIKTFLYGKIAGLPLMLTMTPKQVTVGNGSSSTVYVVSICYRGTMEELRAKVLDMLANEKQYLLSMDTLEDDAIRAMNESPDVVDVGEDEIDFVAEFFPESVISGDDVEPSQNNSDVEKSKPEPKEEIVQEGRSQEEIVKDGSSQEGSGPGEDDVVEKMLEPVAGYKKVYDALLAETDMAKAMALANRLQKGNILYFLHTENCPVPYDVTIKKPELLKIVEAFLIHRGVTTSPSDAVEKPNSEPVETNQNPGLAPTDPGNNFDDDSESGDDVESLLTDQSGEPLVPWEDQEMNSDFMTPEDEGDESMLPTDIESPVVKTPSKPDEMSQVEERIPQEWDNSGPILKDQLRSLVSLKGQLEQLGVLQPDKWTLHVNYFWDKNKKPIDKAINLTKKQGSNLIFMLETALKQFKQK